MGLCDGVHWGGFGVCGGGFGVVFLVFAGFLGGVGVDLVWGLGACKVIRVAAADAERWRPTPFKSPVLVVLLCASGWWGRPGFGLLCAAGSGKFEKLLRSDPGPLWVWVVPVVSVV